MGKQFSQRYPEKGLKLPTLGQLNSVWRGVLRDPTAQEALDQLKQAGFDITHLTPRDPTLRSPSWADYIAAIPLVENRPSRSHFHRRASLRKHLPLVMVLRNFARQFRDPIREKRLIVTANTAIPPDEDLCKLADEAASFIEKFLSWDWYIRERNPRNALIAELRCTIRDRTRRPHDRELSAVIDAAFRAAHRNELRLDNTTLDRIEKREGEIRVKSSRRLNFCSGLSQTPKSESTRKPKRRR